MLHQVEIRISAPRSLDWIKSLESYQEWHNSLGISFLHVYGPPSSGVTVLASNIVLIINDASKIQDICYLSFSFNRQDALALSEEKLVLSLIRQLLSKRPHLFQHTQCLCGWMMKHQCINLNILWILFKSLLLHIGTDQVLITIFSIQECNSEAGDNTVFARLLSIREIPNLNLKFIIASENPDWAKAYPKDLHNVALEDVQSMRLFLRGLVYRRIQRLLKTRPVWRDMDETITAMFWGRGENQNHYWAMARVQELESELRTTLSTKNAIVERLNSFPPRVDSFFLRMVSKIPKESYPWLLEGLRWILFALRPLTAPELAVAVAFNQDANGTPKDHPYRTFRVLEDEILSDLPGDINRVAGYWVNVSGGRIEVINPELRSFLVKQFMKNKSAMHAELGMKCIRYISWVQKNLARETQDEEMDFGPHLAISSACNLLVYAALYWPLHFTMAEDVDPIAIEMIQNFLANPRRLKFWSSIFNYHRPLGFSSDFSTSMLKTVAAFGLTRLLDKLLNDMKAQSTENQVDLLREAMDFAIEQGHTDAAMTLCARILDLKASPGLHQAAKMGNSGLLKYLLEHDLIQVSIDGLDDFGFSPLYLAAQYGQKGIVDLLLKNEAQVNLIQRDGSSALHVAAQTGHAEIVGLLIQQGADHSLRNKAGYDPLELAAQGGFDIIIASLLLRYNEETKERVHKAENLLHLAAMYGHLSTCALLAENGAIGNTLNKDNETPLHLAVRGGHQETVRALLELALSSQNVSSPDATNNQEQSSHTHANKIDPTSELTAHLTPLQLAARKGYTEIVRLLVEYSHSHVNFPHDCNEALSYAAIEGHWKVISIMLNYTSTQNPIDSNGNTALHLSCKKGHTKIVGRLIDLGKFDVEFRTKLGLTSLHIAAEEGHASVVTELIQRGANIDCQKSNTDGEQTNGEKAIHVAARNGKDLVVAALQDFKDMSADQDQDGNTPVMLAARAGHTSVLKLLLSTARNKTPEQLWTNSFPLHMAVSNNDEELGRILIDHGYKVDFRNGLGEAPIHVATELKSLSMIKWLMYNGADLRSKNKQGETALFFAVDKEAMEVCKTILEAPADKILEFIDIADGDGDTPLYQACVRQNKSIVQLLLDHKANPNQKCSLGWTPLHQIATSVGAEIMQLLFDAGAEHDINNDYDSTAIILAAQVGREDAVRLLLKQGASARVINSSGSSALHRAAQGGHLECVKLLVEAEADYNLRKNNGLTPLHLAMALSRDDVAEYLVQKGADVNASSTALGGGPLHLALQNSNFEIAKTLIDAGATMKFDSSQFSTDWMEEDILLFALDYPKAFDIESSGEILQHAISSDYTKAATRLIESSMDVNETVGEFCTALQAAAAGESLELIRKLLDKGADPNIFGGRYGSPLNAAIVNENQEAVVLLLAKDVKLDVEYDGRLPVQQAAYQGSTTIVKIILDSGASSSVRDSNGCSLLAYAMHCNSASIVDHLLSRSDVSIEDTDLSGRTPLMTAIVLENVQVVEKLLELKASPNAVDSEQKTALIRAIASRSCGQEMVQKLLQHGADPTLRDCRGRGALYWACLRGEREMVENEILPALQIKGQLTLHNECAFHAAASLIADSSPRNQQAIAEILLQKATKPDLNEIDGDGWTALYKATKFGMTGLEETLAQAMILYNFTRQSDGLAKPSKWHLQDKGPCLQVSQDGKCVTVGSKFSLAKNL